MGTPQESRKEMVRDYHHLAPDEEVAGKGAMGSADISQKPARGG